MTSIDLLLRRRRKIIRRLAAQVADCEQVLKGIEAQLDARACKPKAFRFDGAADDEQTLPAVTCAAWILAEQRRSDARNGRQGDVEVPRPSSQRAGQGNCSPPTGCQCRAGAGAGPSSADAAERPPRRQAQSPCAGATLHAMGVETPPGDWKSRTAQPGGSLSLPSPCLLRMARSYGITP